MKICRYLKRLVALMMHRIYAVTLSTNLDKRSVTSSEIVLKDLRSVRPSEIMLERPEENLMVELHLEDIVVLCFSSW